jgi:uncharacterized protein
MKNTFLILISILILLIPVSFAKEGHMKLLAVRETGSGYEGGVADLFLEIQPGSGRVFLETFPLTRTDTQMSTRFAKAIACDAIDNECDDLDFFYTITANSPIIAGPSAGSSIAVLTIAVLQDLRLNDNYATTGTINSGGLIGPVGGLKAKVEAAKRNGLKKVFIPAGELLVNLDNTTTNLKNLSKELDIEIMEVSTLNQIVEEFTGKKLNKNFKKIEINEEYKDTMKSLAKDLCERGAILKSETAYKRYSSNVTAILKKAKNLSSKGVDSFEKSDFYSSASYCFGANVEYSTLKFIGENLSVEDAIKELNELKKEIRAYGLSVENIERKTITDLEAYIVVKERLLDAESTANDALKSLETNKNPNEISRTLAYAEERLNSAYSWGTFLGNKGKEFQLNNEVLKKSCQSKISEAIERAQYVEIYFPQTLDNVNNQINNAHMELGSENYELCLAIASKAKADVDVILSVFGVSPEQYNNLLETKLQIVKNLIAEQTLKGAFPILSYSYYEYANSLKETDFFSALIYSEYALELGNLEIYFKEEKKVKKRKFDIDEKSIGLFLFGAVAGTIITSILAFSFRPKKEVKVPYKKSKK